jgi:hypothetical protein
MNPLGYAWLIRQSGLEARTLAVESRLATRMRSTRNPDGTIVHEYPPHYAPEETIVGHLEFALKHDGVDLCLLQAIFRACGPAPIEGAIRARPTGKYARLLGFYYELSTGQPLDAALAIGGNYVVALPPGEYIVSPAPRRNRRWRVLDNLLGDGRFCPIVRLTPELAQGLAAPLQAELRGLVDDFPPELFQRASDYLYLKETRSTYGIERESMPPADRARRFVALLRSAGHEPLAQVLTEAELVKRQNLIVDPRYAAAAYRADQNYVGEQRPDFSQRVYYVCPPPQFVPPLMAGLAGSAERAAGLHAIVHAAVVAFGFVFIHPFEDGNGRLHRFLIHDLLHRDGFVAPGVMLPVSATMLRRMPEYDAALERYSRPLMSGLVAYDLDEQGNVTVTNPEDVGGYYRFPDLTPQVEYLLRTVGISIREDFAEELRFLRGYDAARQAIRAIADIPDRRLDLLLRLLHQNQGHLAKGKRGQFAELADEELARIEAAFAEGFG